jgi:hypothetical protein
VNVGYVGLFLGMGNLSDVNEVMVEIQVYESMALHKVKQPH